MRRRPVRPCSTCGKPIMLSWWCEAHHTPGEDIACLDCCDMTIAEAIQDARDQREDLARILRGGEGSQGS